MTSYSPLSNRDRIVQFYDALNSRDVDSVMHFYGPDASIEVVIDGPHSGVQPASREFLAGFFAAFPEIEFSIDGLIAEGDRVAAEIRSKGKLADGKPYANRYHNLFELRDGKIVTFREYPTGATGA